MFVHYSYLLVPIAPLTWEAVHLGAWGEMPCPMDDRVIFSKRMSIYYITNEAPNPFWVCIFFREIPK